MTRPNYLTTPECVNIAHCAHRRALDYSTHTSVVGEIDTLHAMAKLAADTIGRLTRGGNPL